MRPQRRDACRRLGRGGGLAHDLDVLGALEQEPESLADDVVVVEQVHADRVGHASFYTACRRACGLGELLVLAPARHGLGGADEQHGRDHREHEAEDVELPDAAGAEKPAISPPMTEPTRPSPSVARMPRSCLPGLIRRASAPMMSPAMMKPIMASPSWVAKYPNASGKVVAPNAMQRLRTMSVFRR